MTCNKPFSKKIRATLAIALSLIPIAFAYAQPRVDVFAPQGEAKAVRQVSARFSEPMVAFGDLRLTDPFSVRCSGLPATLKGRGRWADSKNWIYDFDTGLPAGVRCSYTFSPDLKSLAGLPVEGQREFNFDTGGPAAIRSLPRERHDGIDDEQIFLLGLDTEVDAQSASNAWCEAEGVNERIPIKFLAEKETRDVLTANRASFNLDDARSRDLTFVAVRCTRRLPADAAVAIVLGAGLKSKTGIARSAPQRLTFKVRPAFVVSLTCQRVSEKAACLPATPIVIAFNAPVPRSAAAEVRLKSQSGQNYEPQIEPNEKTVQSIAFKGPFPEKTRFTVELPRNFRDDAGREPDNKSSFPLATATDDFPPLAKFPGRFGILELNAEPILPVTVRGIEIKVAGRKAEITPEASKSIPGRSLHTLDEVRIIERLRAFKTNDDAARAGLGRDPRPGEVSVIRNSDQATAFELPRPGDEKPLEVIGIPLPKAGFYVVELASPRLGRALHGEDLPYYVATTVLVTNLAVHLKHGRESSLLWVTTLDRGLPVADARVTVRDCHGKLWFEGKTDRDGVAMVGDRLPLQRDIPKCQNESELIAFARLGDDLSFTYSDWNDGIEPWNFKVRSETYRSRPLAIHTVFDRTLLRAGETVSMKHIARVPTGSGFAIPQEGRLPRAAQIEHVGSGQKFKLSTSFDASGVAESTWTIPAEAKLGSYSLSWPGAEIESQANFRVEAFRVPLMRATIAAPKEALVKPQAAKLDAAVSYLAGGPASGLAVRVRHRIEERRVAFADYPDFKFGGKPLKEGIVSGAMADSWDFDQDEADRGGDPQTAREASRPAAPRSVTLDSAGSAAITIDKLPVINRPANLLVEMEYNDPNGELLTASARVPLHPAEIYVGIKPEGWAAAQSNVRAQVIAVDPNGKALAGRAVSVDVYERKSYSNRRRVLGGFYAYEHTIETKRLGSGCTGVTDARGLLACTIKPRASGELILLARTLDSVGREAYADASVWVRGPDDWWFEPDNNDRVDLIPEKKSYEPGEVAKFQLRMPFRAATVLVTVEREGVLRQHVVTLDAKSPIIEVPVVGSDGPNVFVSALAVRGRVDPEVPGPYAWLKRIFYRIGHWLGLVDEIPPDRDTRPTALIDLSKPAYKLGIAEIKVGRRDYALNVKVTAERDAYRVRETARVTVAVTDSSGKPAANGEIALAAVDEGLLELQDNGSWKILEALLGERPIEVATATAQGQVIGKRHFGRKALAPGGGGGAAGARELFQTLLLWKGRIALDADGRAAVDIPLNDSLTGFRIVAVAQAGADRFGSGAASIHTTQDLMLFSGLPPVVRQNDDFNALFTLRNTTARQLTTQLDWVIRDRAGDDTQVAALASGKQDVTLASNESKLVTIPMKVPLQGESLHWQVSAGAQDGARDTLRVVQSVREVHPVRVYQATLERLEKRWELPVEKPAGALPDRGGIRVEVLDTLAGELPAVREFFARYPYACLEQRTSIAIGLGDPSRWKALAASVPNYLDRDGLARYFPTDFLAGSEVLTAYLVQIAHESGYAWPDEVLARMLAGLEAYVTGRITRASDFAAADLTLRKLAAIEALARHGRAKPEMLDSINIDPALLPASALIDWIGILKRVPAISQRDQRLKDASRLLRAKINFQGTVMTFSNERADALWWLMVSSDVNANRALLAVLDQPEWREDVGRLVRGSLSRHKRGRWDTTVANAWGSVAMRHYAQTFEKVPASGDATVELGGASVAMKIGKDQQIQDFAWPAQKQNLTITYNGSGAPWAIIQSRAALPLTAPVSSGYAIKRTLTAVEQKDAAGYSRGDVYRVTLEIDAQSDMTWVVVDDPIPSGAVILGSGLARDAGSLVSGEKREGSARPAFIERSFEAYRAYYQFLPKGRFKLEYTVRVNNPGRFELPATRVEALYAPEMFGELPNSAVSVRP